METYKIKVYKNVNSMNRIDIEDNLNIVYIITRSKDNKYLYNLYSCRGEIYFESDILEDVSDKIRNEIHYNDLKSLIMMDRIHELKYIKIVEVKELDQFLELTVKKHILNIDFGLTCRTIKEIYNDNINENKLYFLTNEYYDSYYLVDEDCNKIMELNDCYNVNPKIVNNFNYDSIDKFKNSIIVFKIKSLNKSYTRLVLEVYNDSIREGYIE